MSKGDFYCREHGKLTWKEVHWVPVCVMCGKQTITWDQWAEENISKRAAIYPLDLKPGQVHMGVDMAKDESETGVTMRGMADLQWVGGYLDLVRQRDEYMQKLADTQDTMARERECLTRWKILLNRDWDKKRHVLDDVIFSQWYSPVGSGPRRLLPKMKWLRFKLANGAKETPETRAWLNTTATEVQQGVEEFNRRLGALCAERCLWLERAIDWDEFYRRQLSECWAVLLERGINAK